MNLRREQKETRRLGEGTCGGRGGGGDIETSKMARHLPPASDKDMKEEEEKGEREGEKKRRRRREEGKRS